MLRSLLRTLLRNLLVPSVRKLASLANPRTIVVEDVRNGAAGEGNESEERASPLIAQSVMHLSGEEDGSATPKAADASFRRESGCRFVLVGSTM